ncbi:MULTISPECIES: TIM-barrel domain-containing protein [Acidobacteriaceae]|uniref:TIM-barrel domain-containing protein n=1 Tax=Acidobacteriaceae TaxID=204434 RepID=UPI00131C21F6|nr:MULTISPECIES: TIM-barrel domain-containing protein [Acidobacteriaceae]MDW5266240.1 glycoside hydrolase family 31 protein [Edaphobacter sp.]
MATALAANAEQNVRLHADGITFRMESQGGRYSFSYGKHPVVAADATAGVLLDGSPVTFERVGAASATKCVLKGASAAGKHLRLTITLGAHQAEMLAEPEVQGAEVRFATGGAAPAYGLADHAVEQAKFSTLTNRQFNTDVTGFADNDFLSGQGATRLVSNFVIYPKQQFAELLIDPTTKIVHTSAQQIVQGVKQASSKVRLFYFFGDPHAIYAAYLKARNDAGYKVWMPKYPAFGVGWEAFGALGWDTNTTTVRDSVDHYIADGYPLRWVVIGSGFWPSKPDTMHETTSFGLWDKEKYPDPHALVQHFLDDKLAVMLGLRITFIVGGPYSDEGVAHRYFLMKNGNAQVFKGGWPKQPYYLLDAQNTAAVDWYMSLVKKWQTFGINGWKEDFYGYQGYSLRDDKVDPTNDRLMAQRQLVIERNGYLSSNGDLHRINDFNYNQNQDRGPVNALALAYSGFPFVYPDIVGGTFGESRFHTNRTPRLETYMIRNAQWAAMHSSMGMGEPPWSFAPNVAKVMLQSAKFHARIAPYLFSNARRFYADGYPWTMTPLPIAYPNDPQAYGRENATTRAYEWLIGDSMLATPLYGDDYATANSRDVYLPTGRWMDFDTGKIYSGNQTLKDFGLPPGKTPLFIGGSGITLEEVDSKVRICVYPVAQTTSAILTLPESDQVITVHVHGLTGTTAWPAIRVKNGAGKIIASRTEGHGFSFIPTAGQTYSVEAVR